MYFMINPASSYSYILDLEERSEQIIKQEGLPEDFKPSDMLKEAMGFYRQMTITPSQELLQSALIGAKKVGDFLMTVDLTEEDDKGKPKYPVSTITSALKDVEKIVSSLQSLQKKVEQELEEENGKARGAQELTLGDVGLD